MRLNILYDKNILPVDYDYKLYQLFEYQNIELVYTDNVDDIDVLFFDYINTCELHDWKEKEITTRELKNNICYKIAIKNPNIPKLFFHSHELLTKENYNSFIDFFSIKLMCDKSSIFLIDTLLFNRNDLVEVPLLTKIRQFNLQPNKSQVSRSKKFASLINKPNRLRIKVFDSFIKEYDGDVLKLRSENFISFRNSQETSDWYPSDDLSIFVTEKPNLNYSIDFYKSINLPWLIDDTDINPYIDMYNSMNEIYSNSFFSLITESDDSWEVLSSDYIPFSEKVVIPLLCGNLPFAIVDKNYYRIFTEAGFDFSYLFTIFGIDYLNNSARQNYEMIPSFVKFLKDKSLEEINKIYDSVSDKVFHNQKIMENIVNNIPSDSELKFIEELKQLKYKL